MAAIKICRRILSAHYFEREKVFHKVNVRSLQCRDDYSSQVQSNGKPTVLVGIVGISAPAGLYRGFILGLHAAFMHVQGSVCMHCDATQQANSHVFVYASYIE